MSMLDSILGQVNQNADIKNLAAKVGLSPDQVQQAVLALGQAHPKPGDTVATAAASTGLPAGILSQIVEHLGGEGALGQLSSVLTSGAGAGILGQLTGGAKPQGAPDANAGSGVLGQLEGMAKGMFGSK